MLWLPLGPRLPVGQPWESLLRVGTVAAVLWLASADIIRTLRVRHAAASITLGLAVAALWVAPDQLLPGWRDHAWFQNGITGHVTTSIAPSAFTPLVLTLRIARAVVLVPVLEELFWRGWMPRWLASPSWERLPIGHYTAVGFIGTALLFAVEHGPFWDVGLACGLVYNWWAWRTRSLGDLVLVHAVTNAALAAFVLVTRQYGYWM
jgi:CAAX prenyl protease-like protein